MILSLRGRALAWKKLADWAAIEKAIKSGLGYAAVAEAHGITRQAVWKKAMAEGWISEEMTDEPTPKGAWLIAIRQTDICKAQEKRDEGQGTAVTTYGVPFDSSLAASICRAIARGDSEKVAIDRSGFDRPTWEAWKRTDPTFAAVVRRARAECAAGLRQDIRGHAKRDWRAAQYLLEKTEDTAEYVTNAENGIGGGIQVTINVSRDESVAINAGVKNVIDVTPEKP